MCYGRRAVRVTLLLVADVPVPCATLTWRVAVGVTLLMVVDVPVLPGDGRAGLLRGGRPGTGSAAASATVVRHSAGAVLTDKVKRETNGSSTFA